MAERLLDINPDLQLTVLQEFLDPKRATEIVAGVGLPGGGSSSGNSNIGNGCFGAGARNGGSTGSSSSCGDGGGIGAGAAPARCPYDYVIDCIDSVAPKEHLILAAVAQGAKVVSSMGAGGRLDPSRVRVADISETYGDPFAATVRKGLRRHGLSAGVTVVFSDEPPAPASLALTRQAFKRSYYGTSSWMPALFGLNIAAHLVQEVLAGRPLHPPPSARRLAKRAKRATARAAQRRAASSGDGGGAAAAAAQPPHPVQLLPGQPQASPQQQQPQPVQLRAEQPQQPQPSQPPQPVQLRAAQPQQSQQWQQPQLQGQVPEGLGLPTGAAGAPGAEPGASSHQVLHSFAGVQGVGMGMDGFGI